MTQVMQANGMIGLEYIGAVPPQAAGHEPSYKVLRRNNTVVDFDPKKISVAMTKAFLAVQGQDAPESSGIKDLVHKLSNPNCRHPQTPFAQWRVVAHRAYSRPS